jgi:circadian clock protein KaiC
VSDRLLSGHEPLDVVLGGGLPANAISLIMGLPGTGKTIIAQQYVFQNGGPERPAVYFSTASEPLEKIVRFGQSLDFFDRSAIGRSVFYEDLGETVSDDGLAGVTRQLTAVLRERHPRLIVIDSFKALSAFADSHREFRKFLHELAGTLTAFPVSSLWIGEYQEDETGSLAEFAVADAILALEAERIGQREIRFLTEAAWQRLPVWQALVQAQQQRGAPVPAARRHPDKGGVRAGRYPGVLGYPCPG